MDALLPRRSAGAKLAASQCKYTLFVHGAREFGNIFDMALPDTFSIFFLVILVYVNARSTKLQEQTVEWRTPMGHISQHSVSECVWQIRALLLIESRILLHCSNSANVYLSNGMF